MGSIITLTTDFGLADAYVAAMKGVILSINKAVLRRQSINCPVFTSFNVDKRWCVCYSAWQKSDEGGLEMQAYCMKCRKKVEIKSPQSVTLKNKRPATQGVCPSCGTKVFRIGKG